MNLTIRPLTDNDLDAVNLILQASYGDAQDRIPRLHRYQRLQPDGWFLALLDDAPAGVIGTVDYGPFAYIGLLGVHPYAQRRGVGTTLMDHLLAWLDSRSCPIALLDATNIGAPLYHRLGFAIEEQVWVFQRQRSITLPNASTARPIEASDLAEITAFDAPIFGATRQAVFEAVLPECAGRAFVTRDAAGRVSGYLFGQPNLLGPWAACTPDDAEALLAAVLPLYNGEPLNVIVPATNRAARDLLELSGFVLHQTLRHMRRGGTTHPSNRALLYGQTSFAIG